MPAARPPSPSTPQEEGEEPVHCKFLEDAVGRCGDSSPPPSNASLGGVAGVALVEAMAGAWALKDLVEVVAVVVTPAGAADSEEVVAGGATPALAAGASVDDDDNDNDEEEFDDNGQRVNWKQRLAHSSI
uniref:Uncharacterized protein n=1 Tax=Leersia perrieri TaxID=77586 RepID=A0A0D9W3D7_9ORYZ